MDAIVPTEDLTKITLNNQIVLLRKVIKTSKLYVIRGLIKKCKKLKSTLQRDNQMIKASGKHDRLLLEINEIKKLKPDEISRFVLTNEKPFGKIVKEGTLRDRALARLSEQPNLKNEICKFREKYPKWSTQVPSLYNIWDFEVNVMNKKKHKKSKDHNDREEFQKDVKVIIKRDINQNESQTTETQNSHSEKNIIEEDGSERTSLKSLSEKLKSQQKTLNAAPKNMGDKVIEVIKMKDADEEILLEKPTKSHTKNLPLKMEPKKPKSSFFLGMDNELEDSESEQEKDFEDPDSFQHKFSKKTPKANFNKPKTHKNVNDAAGRQPSKISTKREQVDRQNHNIKGFNKPTNSTISERLHPSWEAKRKQSLHIIKDFKANKITFDD